MRFENRHFVESDIGLYAKKGILIKRIPPLLVDIYGHTLISQGNSWYYLYNAHGDVVKYINANGAVLKSYDYDAFGEEADPSTTDTNPFRYAGQYFDDETGTYYLRARYYNPGNGRFTQQDSWGYADPEDPLSLNLYVYCYGNPLMFVDINGHWPTWSQIGTALLIGVAAVATAAAVVATAGAAGAAIGYAAGFYLGVSASTAATITTVATGAAYVVAGANIVVGANDINEVFTGHNIIRDDLMGGNQALYADAKMILAIGSASFIQIALASGLIGPMGEPYQGARNPSQDFVKGKRLATHFSDHASEFGIDDVDDYVKAAEHFLTKTPTSTTSSFVTESGTYFRYDSATNEFGIMNQYGGISTYFKPDAGLDYWIEQMNKYYYK